MSACKAALNFLFSGCEKRITIPVINFTTSGRKVLLAGDCINEWICVCEPEPKEMLDGGILPKDKQ